MSGPERIVRPTLRCLIEDLAHELGPDELRVAVRAVREDMVADATYLLPCPLVEAEHPTLDKANLIATDAAAVRERIETIRDRFLTKVKTADRRAALWQDDAGTWWLLAAGRRKDDGAGDFYRDLERLDGDSSTLAPTGVDERFRLLEEAFALECAAERSAQAVVLHALLRAASAMGIAVDVELFGAVVSVRIEPDEGGLAVIELSWEFARFDEQDRFPYDVLAMVPGMESIDLWQYLPPRSATDSPHTWFAYVPQVWVDHLATSAELDDLLASADDWTPPNPATDGSEFFSHRASGKVVTLAYLTGIEIVGLCGARVVAHRDYEKFPVCPVCEESLVILRGVRDAAGA